MSANCRTILHLQKPRQRRGSAEVLPIRPGLKVFNVRQVQPLPPEQEQEQEVDSNTLRDTRTQSSASRTERAPAAQPAKRVKRRTKYGFM